MFWTLHYISATISLLGRFVYDRTQSKQAPLIDVRVFHPHRVIDVKRCQ